MSMSKPLILYHNRLDDAAPTASTTAAGYDVDNLADWRPYTWWQPTAMPATVTVNCGSAKPADYALVWGHDLYSKSATLEIRGSTDNFSSSDVLVDTITPTSDDPFLLQFASASYQYWRFKITGAGGNPSLAIAAIGVAMEMECGVELGFDPLMRRITGQSNISESGNPLGKSIAFEEWGATLRFPQVAWTWMRTDFIPAWKAHLRSTPFVFAWDPGDHDDELYLVTSADTLSAPHDNPDYCALSFDVRGLAL